MTGEKITVKETLRELDALSRLRKKELAGRQKSGEPFIAYSGSYIPEEILRTAGAQTFLLCKGGETVPANLILNGQLRFMNPLARTMAGYPGTFPEAPDCSLLIIQQTDCHTARAGEYLEFQGWPVYLTGIPAERNHPASFDYYVESLQRMIEKAEEVTGQKTDPSTARENLIKSNRINALFRRLDLLRKTKNPPFRFCDWIRLHHISFLLDADVMIEKLEGLCSSLEGMTDLTDQKEDKNLPRILLAGRAVAPGDYTVPAAIEESGAVIAAQILDEGIRVYEKDVETDGDLLQNFAKNRYLDTKPANFMQSSWEERFSYLMRDVQEYGIDGVVWYQLSFDEIYDMEFSFLAQKTAEKGIPLIKLESSYNYSSASMGMLMTRVESFVESVRDVKCSRIGKMDVLGSTFGD